MSDIKKPEELVTEFIRLKKEKDELEEKIDALDLLILSNEEARNDNRIIIVKGREKITLKDDLYERLETMGYSTEKLVTLKKELTDFDIEIQEIILSNEKNYDKKVSKESIRIKKGEK